MDDIIAIAERFLSLDLPFPQKLNKALSLCSEEVNKAIEEFFTVTALEDPQMVQAIISTLSDKRMFLYEKYIEAGKKDGYIDTTIPTSTFLDYVKAFQTIGNVPDNLEQAKKYKDDLFKLFINGLLLKR